MTPLWIVDRSPRRRAALARLAGAAESAVLGAPGDPRFESAPAPGVVMLALDGDWELELQFAHASGERAAGARWILLGARADEQAALELFDTRDAEFLVYPPPAERLRSRLGDGRHAGDGPPPLSMRARKAAIAARFARWFGDLELPELLRALDPRLTDVPVLIRGESGSGRGLIARYVHCFGRTGRCSLAHVSCSERTRTGDLVTALVEERARYGTPPLAIWLEGLHRLSRPCQRELLGWLEFGPPGGAGGTGATLRWIATVDADALADLDPDLRLAFESLLIALPPLRERTHAIASIAVETARVWCAARQLPPRRFGEDALAVMEEYPWPGNLRELEALVVQSLVASPADPLHADDLQLGGMAFAPLEVGEVGSLIEEERPREPVHAPSEAEIDTLLGNVTPAPERAAPSPPTARLHSHPQPEPEADARPPQAAGDGELARLVAALSHEVRNPLATIRTFSDLLPERFHDPEFRERFAQMVRDDIGRIDELVGRLAGVANLAHPERDKVDVAALLEELLEERRQRIRAQRLLVLKELDTREPHALCDRAQLRFALDTLLGKALEWVPTHGDVYLASRHHPGSGSAGPSMRVLIRFHHPDGGGASAHPERGVESSLELMIAEIVVRAQGGTLTLTATDAEETVLVIDLPAP